MIELMKHGIRLRGREVPMPRMEQRLLLFFLEHPNTVLSRELLLREVWGYAFAGNSRTVDTHVKNLRAHLGELGNSIVTVRGVGYRMDYVCGDCCCDCACHAS